MGTSFNGFKPAQLKLANPSSYPSSDHYVCYAKKQSSPAPAPTNAPFNAGSAWKLVAKNAYGSAVKNKNSFTPYAYGKAKTIQACATLCTELHRCIGFSFMGVNSYCFLWLTAPVYSLGFRGWHLQSRGVVGLLPNKLVAGKAVSSSYQLITYAQTSPHKLSSGAEDEEAPVKLPEDATQSPIPPLGDDMAMVADEDPNKPPEDFDSDEPETEEEQDGLMASSSGSESLADALEGIEASKTSDTEAMQFGNMEEEIQRDPFAADRQKR